VKFAGKEVPEYMTIEDMVLDEGYWRHTTQTAEVTACERSEWCSGGRCNNNSAAGEDDASDDLCESLCSEGA